VWDLFNELLMLVNVDGELPPYKRQQSFSFCPFYFDVILVFSTLFFDFR
jgi:hypothetical protein